VTKEFRIEREVVVEASPEQAFAAVTEDTAGWMFPTPPLDPAAPGTPVRIWQPPHHVAVRVDGPDGRFNALEYLIEARDGSTVVVHYVHEGIFVDDWDTQYDGASRHTDFYLHSLTQYLRYFTGRPITHLAVAGPAGSARPDSFTTLLTALGLGADTAVGDPVTLEIPGLDHIESVVDYLTPQFAGLRASDALYRFYGRNHFGGTVDLAHHLFTPGIRPEPAQTAWRNWLTSLYPA
jgi:hypothetical protein